MTEQELAQLPLLSREIEQYQARLQGADLNPAAYCQSVRHVVAEHRQWVEELLERRVAERDGLEGVIRELTDGFSEVLVTAAEGVYE